MIIIKAYQLWKKKLELKLAFYNSLCTLMNSHKDILELAVRTITILKETPEDKLKEEIISKIAILIKEQASYGIHQ